MTTTVSKHLFSCAIVLAALAISACSTSGTPPIEGSLSRVAGPDPLGALVDPFGTNLINNGSFERPVVPVGGFLVFSGGMSFSGHWKVGGGSIDIVSTTFSQNGFTFPAKCGVQWLNLAGNGQTYTEIDRRIETAPPGGQYTLTFAVGNVVNPGGPFGTTSTVLVLVNGALKFTATNSNGSGQTKQVWKSFSVPITAQYATTEISFWNNDPSGDTDNGLDCVKLIHTD
jgi:hypothetical protein